MKNDDILQAIEAHDDLTMDRLLSSHQAEWAGVISFNGLLVGAAAVSQAVGESDLKTVRILLIACSLLSTFLVMMNATSTRKTYQDIFNVRPGRPDAFARAEHLVKNGGIVRRRQWMERRSVAANVLMAIAALLTMYCVAR